MYVLYFLNLDLGLSLNAHIGIFWEKPFLGNDWDHSWREWFATHGTSVIQKVLPRLPHSSGFLSATSQETSSIWFSGEKLALGCLRSWGEAVIYSLAVRFPARSLSLKRPHLLTYLLALSRGGQTVAVGALLLHATRGTGRQAGLTGRQAGLLFSSTGTGITISGLNSCSVTF